MSIKVNNKDKSVRLDASVAPIFFGHTGEGIFPPIGKKYETFSFTPKKGDGGVLAFTEESWLIENFWVFYHYEWVEDKLIVYEDLSKITRNYFAAEDLGIVVPFRNWFYVTLEPQDTDNNYKVVDLMEMLKYLEGRISLADLDRNARSVERQAKHVVRMAELERVLLAEQKNAENLRNGLLAERAKRAELELVLLAEQKNAENLRNGLLAERAKRIEIMTDLNDILEAATESWLLRFAIGKNLMERLLTTWDKHK